MRSAPAGTATCLLRLLVDDVVVVIFAVTPHVIPTQCRREKNLPYVSQFRDVKAMLVFS